MIALAWQYAVPAALSLAVAGAFNYRWHGGGFFKAPRTVKNLAWALPFAVTAWGCHIACLMPWWQTALITAAAVGASLLGVSTGHGRGQSLGEPMKPGSTPEKLEYLVIWLQKILPNYFYKLSILIVCGLAMNSGGVIGFLAVGNYRSAVICAAGGALSPIAYVAGWLIYPHENGRGPTWLHQATQIGEFFTGFICYAGLGIAIIAA